MGTMVAGLKLNRIELKEIIYLPIPTTQKTF
jgi:hypothetical protein